MLFIVTSIEYLYHVISLIRLFDREQWHSPIVYRIHWKCRSLVKQMRTAACSKHATALRLLLVYQNACIPYMNTKPDVSIYLTLPPTTPYTKPQRTRTVYFLPLVAMVRAPTRRPLRMLALASHHVVGIAE